MSKQTNLGAKAQIRQLGYLLLCLLFLTISCSDQDSESGTAPSEQNSAVLPTTVPTASELATATPTAEPAVDAPTLAPPTFTPTPQLIAMVNQAPIPLSLFEQELARYEQAQIALGFELDENYRERVLTKLIEDQVIAQAADANGIVVSAGMVDERLAELIELAGGQENFEAWLEVNQLSADEFPSSLATEILTEQVVQFVTASVPFEVEQVRARYIEVNELALAQSLVEQARAGADFAFLAQTHSLDQTTGPVGGDLGFFARGSLLVPELEVAAFALDINAVSDVIAVTHSNGQTSYYLIQLIERDSARPLTDAQRSLLLRETFESWLTEQLLQAEIIRYSD